MEEAKEEEEDAKESAALETVHAPNAAIKYLTEGVFRCRSEMSDPRVTGWVDWTLDPYYIYYTTPPRTGRMEASAALTPDEGGGSWRGTGFGVDIWNDDGLSTVFHTEYIGEGEYEGLVYREWGSQKPGSDGYEVIGYIQDAE